MFGMAPWPKIYLINFENPLCAFPWHIGFYFKQRKGRVPHEPFNQKYIALQHNGCSVTAQRRGAGAKNAIPLPFPAIQPVICMALPKKAQTKTPPPGEPEGVVLFLFYLSKNELN